MKEEPALFENFADYPTAVGLLTSRSLGEMIEKLEEREAARLRVVFARVHNALAVRASAQQPILSVSEGEDRYIKIRDAARNVLYRREFANEE